MISALLGHLRYGAVVVHESQTSLIVLRGVDYDSVGRPL